MSIPLISREDQTGWLFHQNRSGKAIFHSRFQHPRVGRCLGQDARGSKMSRNGVKKRSRSSTALDQTPSKSFARHSMITDCHSQKIARRPDLHVELNVAVSTTL